MAARSLEHPTPPGELTQPLEPRVDGGRLGVYAALGATVGSVPLPWVPDALVRRVRGALVHDVAVRHGLSLSQAARDVLADPAGPEAPSAGAVSRALRYVGVRIAVRALTRVGPVGAIWPLRHALRVYVLGYLFDRYLNAPKRPASAGTRIEEAEARRVRVAIDSALARATSASPAPVEEPADVDDQRDPTTMFVDGLLGAAAGVPSHLKRRLDAAFDQLLSEGDG